MQASGARKSAYMDKNFFKGGPCPTEPGVLTVKTAEREALAGTDPDIFYWTPHHERSPRLVLVRLERIDRKLLEELLADSYRLAGGEQGNR
jgi:hypothetical protein